MEVLEVLNGDCCCRYVTWTNDVGASLCIVHHLPPPPPSNLHISRNSGVLCARLGLTCRCICGHLLADHAAAVPPPPPLLPPPALAPPPPPHHSDDISTFTSAVTCSAPSLSSSHSITACKPAAFKCCSSCPCRRFTYMYAASKHHQTPSKYRDATYCKTAQF